jgi:hypothetical protein
MILAPRDGNASECQFHDHNHFAPRSIAANDYHAFVSYRTANPNVTRRQPICGMVTYFVG